MLSNIQVINDAAIELNNNLSNGIYKPYFDYDYIEHYHESEYELWLMFS